MLSDSSFFDQVYAISAMDHVVLNNQCHFDHNLQQIQVSNDLVYFKEHLSILEGFIRLWILQVYYDFSTTGYFEFNKIL